MTNPGAFKSYKHLAIVSSILCLSAACSVTVLGLLAYCLCYHPRIGVTALCGFVALGVWWKLDIRKGEKWLMDHPECNEHEDYPTKGGE